MPQIPLVAEIAETTIQPFLPQLAFVLILWALENKVVVECKAA
jgi:hypothetical protein